VDNQVVVGPSFESTATVGTAQVDVPTAREIKRAECADLKTMYGVRQLHDQSIHTGFSLHHLALWSTTIIGGDVLPTHDEAEKVWSGGQADFRVWAKVTRDRSRLPVRFFGVKKPKLKSAF
jgi:hypothetical protein